MFVSSVDTSLGVKVLNLDGRMIARGASYAKGDLVLMDLAFSDDATLTAGFDDEASCFCNVVAPTAASVAGGAILGITLEAIADDADGLVRFVGVVDEAFVIRAASNIAAGDPLVGTVPGTGSGGDLDGVMAAGERHIAIALEAATAPTTRTLKRVLFNGITGFGTDT